MTLKQFYTLERGDLLLSRNRRVKFVGFYKYGDLAEVEYVDSHRRVFKNPRQLQFEGRGEVV